MMRFRPAVLLASFVLGLSLCATSADAAAPQLSTAPPGPMPTQTASQATAPEGTLPRTGIDVGLEALLALVLVAGGTAFRTAAAAPAE